MAKQSHKKRKKSIITRKPLFSKHNYLFILIGIALVAIGFTAMYMENEVNGFISLFVSPLLILGGYGTVVYAIMAKRNGENHSDELEMSSH